MRLLIIGPQGAGKGTQAERVTAELGVPHISTGDLFRDNIGRGTELGLLAQQYMDRGELVPDGVTQSMLADRLAQPDVEPGFLLDGFPRNVVQADWLDGLLTSRSAELEKVILLTAPDAVLIERMLTRGRADDTVQAIRRRLDVYHAETEPLIHRYGDIVARVDGVGEIDVVTGRILAGLGLAKR